MVMGEETYMDKEYCLECATKHSNRLEHHLEDLVTSQKDNPELRSEAQEMLDKIREIRKRIDDMRINELAYKKLQSIS
jgi:predicted outer membrane protein